MKLAFLFPGQGDQTVGMGKDFAAAYPVARETFEEADSLLNQHLSRLIFEGPLDVLTQTRHSQLGIFVASIAMLRVLQKEFPHFVPSMAAGLSLGEYSALVAAGKLSFPTALLLVRDRAQFMNDACEKRKGTMAAVLGLEADEVRAVVQALNLPRDLWIANINCPKQVVISGTLNGIEQGMAALRAKGAKKVVPLEVHGAFHSGLMQEAQERLAASIQAAPLQKSAIELVMNVPGDFVSDEAAMRDHMTRQVTHSVLWQKGVEALAQRGVAQFVSIGPGSTLVGLNKRIGVQAPTVKLEQVSDLELFSQI